MFLEACILTDHAHIWKCKGVGLCMLLFAGRYMRIFVAVALLCCTKLGSINQINLRNWMNVKGWMKREGTETMTAKREREDETGKRE